jgi:hypothetical protein
MIREITSHKVNQANDNLDISVMDEPGSSGACCAYHIEGADLKSNPCAYLLGPGLEFGTHILFQNGPINESGVNGITHEALLAIIIDRMRSFQEGPYACRENALALTKLEEAKMWLCSRTKERMGRGVEGTHEK